jgi:phage protein U
MRIITKADGRKYLRISRSDISKLQTKLAINWWEREEFQTSTGKKGKGIKGEEIDIPGVQYPSDSAYEEYLEELRSVRGEKLESQSGLENVILYLTKKMFRYKKALEGSKDENEKQKLKIAIKGVKSKIDNFQFRLKSIKGRNLSEQVSDAQPQEAAPLA